MLKLLDFRERGQAWPEGPYDQEGHEYLEALEVFFVGSVNQGKSSLYNRLLGESRALVSPWPGTTRDEIRCATLLAGHEVVMVDTPGREAGEEEKSWSAG
ncbi:MAG: 50S ribosome-binding GTPase, partial [Planctomycetes bacterium]|nr:50S ribosome-binding GTPase [Planctomycetota bacterium]